MVHVKDAVCHSESLQSRDPGISLIAVFEIVENLLHLNVEILSSFMMMMTTTMMICTAVINTHIDRQTDRQTDS